MVFGWPTVVLGAVLLAAAGLLLVSEKRRRRFSHFPSLRGTHVVITGGSSGIGLSLATQVAAEGAYLTIMARSVRKLEDARRQILSSLDLPPDVVRVKSVDVGDASAVAVAIHDAFAWRPIDVLVCSAGILEPNFVEDVKPSRMEEIARTNILGVVYPIQSVIPLMRTRSKDHPSSIVIIGSLSACVFLYGSNMYTVSKAALKGFAELLKFELLPYGIGVTFASPAFTETPMLESAAVEGQRFFDIGYKIYVNHIRESSTDVARFTIEALKRNEFFVSTTSQGVLVRVIGRGFVPPDSISILFLETLLIIPIRLLSFLWVQNAKHVLRTNPVPVND